MSCIFIIFFWYKILICQHVLPFFVRLVNSFHCFRLKCVLQVLQLQYPQCKEQNSVAAIYSQDNDLFEEKDPSLLRKWPDLAPIEIFFPTIKRQKTKKFRHFIVCCLAAVSRITYHLLYHYRSFSRNVTDRFLAVVYCYNNDQQEIYQ